MSVQRCPACQAENRPAVKFCEECGTRLEVVCVSCRARVPADKKFCGECGTAIVAVPPSTPVTSPLADAPAAARRPAAPAATTAPPNLREATPHAYTPAHLAERILKERSALSGERKQVTVLFADVSGFTSISERLDPEDVHAIINRAFELMLAEIHRYEGTVNQFLGDGLMALFGAPVAHEDHAGRAARAALGIQQALARYREELRATRGIEFRVRMGLNTGLVVVGAIGDNLRMDYTAVGDTTNTAARMQHLAEPGQIVIAEAMERLIGSYFETRQLGTFTVKNRAQPVGAYQLGRPKAGVSRLTARASLGLSPFVGRGDASTMLERAFAAARVGQGQAVFVIGDAGMGKSRLLLEFRRQIGDAATWLEGDCISFAQSTAFFPVIEMLKQTFDIHDHDGEADVIGKVERGLDVLGAEARGVAPYLRYLLSIDPGDAAVAGMDPAQRRARILAAIQRLVAAGSRMRPMVLAIEDAHWIDSASEDFLKNLAEGLPGMGVLLLVTYRPVYQHPFGDRTYHWRIILRPVDTDDALQIVRAALGVGNLPPDVATLIARKAEGNPFFLEEIGRTLVETGAVRVEEGRLVASEVGSTLVVPDTVQDVIAARIDRLGEPQKRTVQTASVIGREFALDLLRRVSDVQAELERALADLKRIELIYEKASVGAPEYVFRHALTQDVAYSSLLTSERRRLHALIGHAIEDVYAGRLEEHTEELVYHFTRGNVWDRVAHYAREAGDRAAALCVDDKAVEFYEAGRDALRQLPETTDTARAGIEIRLAMRAPLWRGGHPDRLFALLKEAEDLANRHRHTDRLDTIYAFLVGYHWAKGEQDLALDYGQRCLARADAGGDLALRVTGLYYITHACYALGRYADGVRTARQILDLLDGPRATERFGLSGIPYSGACAHAAECLAELGDLSGALKLLEQGQRVADAANHLYSQMVVAAARGGVLTRGGRTPEAIALLESTVRTCREKHFLGQLVIATRNLGLAYLHADRPAEAIACEQEATALQEKANVAVLRTDQLARMAEGYVALGQLDAAEQHLRSALEFAARQGARGAEAWARLTGAKLAARRGDRAASERYLDQAQRIAEELAMVPLLEYCRALAPTLR